MPLPLPVMGRENGNPMPDRGFTFWGDDDVALATYTSQNNQERDSDI